MTNIHLKPLQNDGNQHDFVLILQKCNVRTKSSSTVGFEHVRVSKFLMVLLTENAFDR